MQTTEQVQSHDGLKPEPDRKKDSLANPVSERVPVDGSARGVSYLEVLNGPDSVLGRQLIFALSRKPLGEGDLVRERASWALSRQRDGRLVEPLIESLGDNDWRVRAYAAWTLALARSREPVPKLLALLADKNWRLRAMAAYALAAIGDVRARPAMIGALQDEAWQVRYSAVDFIGARRDPGDDELLRAALSDRHVAVREAAATALGAILRH